MASRCFGAYKISGEALCKVLSKICDIPSDAMLMKIVPSSCLANSFDVLFESPGFEKESVEMGIPEIKKITFSYDVDGAL